MTATQWTDAATNALPHVTPDIANHGVREPIVSTVIPTFGRARLVTRAVRSALAQTLRDIEVIVVLDGDDPETNVALRALDDPRLRVIALAHNVGPSDARNTGVQASRAKWIAFLDDDDEWEPRKLEAQLACAQRSRFLRPVVSCRATILEAGGATQRPRRYPRVGEPVSEYLFRRYSLRTGESFLGTPTLFAPRELVVRVPFPSGLREYEDYEWCLRAGAESGVGFEFVSEPLVVVHWEHATSRVQRWQWALEWAEANRELFTPRAYAGFLAHRVGSMAAQAGAWETFLPLLRQVIALDGVRPLDLGLYTARWCLHAVRRHSRTALNAAIGAFR